MFSMSLGQVSRSKFLVVPPRSTIYIFNQSFHFQIINYFTYSMGFHGGSAGKKSAHNMGDLGSIPGLGRSAGEGNGYPLKYSGLKNSMDCTVHGVTKS